VSDRITVWDTRAGEMREVTRRESAAGMIRFARSLGPGTPACGAWEQRALELLRNNQSG
jgi:hypothetical protein